MNAITEPSTPVSNRSIGAILIDSGRLTLESAEQIIKFQKEHGLRFGDAAIQLGLLTEQDIQQVLSRQYSYPYLMPEDDAVSEEIIAAFKPFSPIVEQLRVLRSQLMLRWFDAESACKTLAVVSPGNFEGRSFLAANLAVVFSQLGERTLLIDGNMRNPRQHKLFRLENRLGLSTVLSDRGEVQEATIRIAGLMDLSVLPSGATPPNPQELVSRSSFQSMLAKLRDRYDVIIIDTPAAGLSADAQTIACKAKGALVVGRKDISMTSGLRTMVTSLQQAGVVVVGSVLNNG